MHTLLAPWNTFRNLLICVWASPGGGLLRCSRSDGPISAGCSWQRAWECPVHKYWQQGLRKRCGRLRIAGRPAAPAVKNSQRRYRYFGWQQGMGGPLISRKMLDRVFRNFECHRRCIAQRWSIRILTRSQNAFIP